MNDDFISFNFDVQHITSIPTTLIVYYINLFVLLPKFYDGRKFAIYICFLLLLVSLGSLSMRAWAHFIWREWDRHHFAERYLLDKSQFWIPLRILRNGMQVFSVVSLITFLRLARKSYISEKKFGASDTGRYVWLRTTMNSTKDQVLQTQLGFCDEVCVFADNKLIAANKKQFGQRSQNSLTDASILITL